ncbi:hypothetical protein [Olivibacter sp. XZL3]|uniref:hypothetical protein n=1 Tax=Olivibacter sp. XZL3 TaxID=1735116 RepID=UPI001416FAD1|nr:hypothetical protein [Olivibacter sp. XZL3]
MKRISKGSEDASSQHYNCGGFLITLKKWSYFKLETALVYPNARLTTYGPLKDGMHEPAPLGLP